jgi:hypothetical protein
MTQPWPLVSFQLGPVGVIAARANVAVRPRQLNPGGGGLLAYIVGIFLLTLPLHCHD